MALATADDILHAVEQDGTQTDVHRVAASLMFGVAYEEVTKEQRYAAKAASHLALWSPSTGVVSAHFVVGTNQADIADAVVRFHRQRSCYE